MVLDLALARIGQTSLEQLGCKPGDSAALPQFASRNRLLTDLGHEAALMVRVFRPPNWNHCHQIEDDPDGARSDPTSSSGSYTHVCQWQSGRLSAFPDGSFTPQLLLPALSRSPCGPQPGSVWSETSALGEGDPSISLAVGRPKSANPLISPHLQKTPDRHDDRPGQLSPPVVTSSRRGFQGGWHNPSRREFVASQQYGERLDRATWRGRCHGRSLLLGRAAASAFSSVLARLRHCRRHPHRRWSSRRSRGWDGGHARQRCCHRLERARFLRLDVARHL